MSKPLKPRRGTTAEQNAFVGEAYEVTYDTDKNTLVCRDGLTPGGFPLARADEVAAKDAAQDEAIISASHKSVTDIAIDGLDLVLTYGDGSEERKDAESLLAGLDAQVAELESNVGALENGVGRASAYITETWSSGTSWYRKYSDGWIEQGGTLQPGVYSTYYRNVSLTFPVAFSNTKYVVLVTGTYTNTTGDGANYIGSRTTAGCTYTIHNDPNADSSWYACGY